MRFSGAGRGVGGGGGCQTPGLSRRCCWNTGLGREQPCVPAVGGCSCTLPTRGPHEPPVFPSMFCPHPAALPGSSSNAATSGCECLLPCSSPPPCPSKDPRRSPTKPPPPMPSHAPSPGSTVPSASPCPRSSSTRSAMLWPTSSGLPTCPPARPSPLPAAARRGGASSLPNTGRASTAATTRSSATRRNSTGSVAPGAGHRLGGPAWVLSGAELGSPGCFGEQGPCLSRLLGPVHGAGWFPTLPPCLYPCLYHPSPHCTPYVPTVHPQPKPGVSRRDELAAGTG